MKGYQALAAALVAEGVDTVFGLLGNGVLQLARHLSDHHRVRFVAARHEEVAVGMADGYSRATGKLGVAIICYGPGLANASAALLAARMSNSRILVVVGAGFGVDPHNNMSFDQPPLLHATIGAVEELTSPATLAARVRGGFQHVRHGKGPIALHFPLSDAEMPADWLYRPGAPLAAHAAAPPAPREIDILGSRLQAARRPVILAGMGAWRAGAGDALRLAAARSGALIATTLPTKNWLIEDTFTVGLSGGFSSADAVELLATADLLVAFGASLNDYTFGHGLLYGAADIVQIDRDPTAFGEYRPVAQAIIGDARLTAEALAAALPKTPPATWRDEAMARRIAAIDRWRGLDLTERPGVANPRAVVAAIDRHAPSDRILVTDIGLFIGVPMAHMRVPTPDDMVLPIMLGRVGCGLPVAMGAALGRPDRMVTLFVGDGGMMASINALDTLAAFRLPVLVVVMDDAGLGAERRLFDLAGQTSTVADHVTPDLVALSGVYGIPAVRVTSSADAEGALAEYSGDGPLLLHVIVDRDVPTTEMDAAYYTRPKTGPGR